MYLVGISGFGIVSKRSYIFVWGLVGGLPELRLVYFFAYYLVLGDEPISLDTA